MAAPGGFAFVDAATFGRDRIAALVAADAAAIAAGTYKSSVGPLDGFHYIGDIWPGIVLTEGGVPLAVMFYELHDRRMWEADAAPKPQPVFDIHFCFTFSTGGGKRAFEHLLSWAIKEHGVGTARALAFVSEDIADKGRNATIMTPGLVGFVRSAWKKVAPADPTDAIAPTPTAPTDPAEAKRVFARHAEDGGYAIWDLHAYKFNGGTALLNARWDASLAEVLAGTMKTAMNVDGLAKVSGWINDVTTAGIVLEDRREGRPRAPVALAIWDWVPVRGPDGETVLQFNVRFMFTLAGGEKWAAFEKVWAGIKNWYAGPGGVPPRVAENEVQPATMAGFVESARKKVW